MTNCIILEATQEYSQKYESLLLGCIQKNIDLFAAFGSYSDQWEEAMDCLCIDLDTSQIQPNAFCNTTSHKNESKEEVFAFAAQWFQLTDIEPNIEYIRI
jgi:hypothetical protein